MFTRESFTKYWYWYLLAILALILVARYVIYPIIAKATSTFQKIQVVNPKDVTQTFADGGAKELTEKLVDALKSSSGFFGSIGGVLTPDSKVETVLREMNAKTDNELRMMQNLWNAYYAKDFDGRSMRAVIADEWDWIANGTVKAEILKRLSDS